MRASGWACSAVGLIALALLMSAVARSDARLVSAQQAGLVELSLNVVPSGNVLCTPAGGKPNKCSVEVGSQFTLAVGMNVIPASGYSAYEVDVRHTGVVSKAVRYVPVADLGVHLPRAGVGGESFRAGAVTGLQAYPLPVTNYLGPLVEADLNCPATAAQAKISVVVPETKVKDRNGGDIAITTVAQGVEQVADTLEINCLDPLDFDKDGDGCTNRQELGVDPYQGGRRNPNNPWDFYDVPGPTGAPRDRYIDLPNDILGVVFKYQKAPPDPAYDAAYDRSHAPPGADPWDMGPPDHYIDLPNDILGVAFQYHHSCQGAP